MSKHMKLIVPLLDECITKEDLSEEAGFVDAYVHDKNRPYIEDCVFLMYDLSKKTQEAYNRECHFYNCKNLSNVKVDFIDGKCYKIYGFTLIGKDMKDVYNGYKPTEKKNVVRILSFWRGYDDDVNDTMLTNKPGRISLDWKTIPEFDYRPDPLMGFGYKKGGTLQ